MEGEGEVRSSTEKYKDCNQPQLQHGQEDRFEHKGGGGFSLSIQPRKASLQGFTENQERG